MLRPGCKMVACWQTRGVMTLLQLIFGRRLASSEDKKQRIGALAGVSVFGLDALSSAAYGPEAALTVLIPLGMHSPNTSRIIICATAGLLLIVYFSYRQTIAAYPKGAGSYTVARENLGTHAGLLAAIALMIDYVLNVAVGISSGVGQLISAIPSLQPFTLQICLAILAILTYLNLRGVRETGFAFMPPTYLFVFCLSFVFVAGAVKTIWSGGHPEPVIAPPRLSDAHASADAWLILRSFASGCTALTGVEAVSNGIQVFREPVVAVARRTLTIIVAILILLLLGVAYLAPAYQIGATEPGKSGYESILSQVTGAVFGRGIFYYVTIASVLLVLSLSANTSFADFPRVCQAIARDGYLPYSFAIRGRRLVYSEGIIVLTAFATILLICFNGVTDRLIPLFAVGSFMAFTLSQAGMVGHWLRRKESKVSAAINGFGSAATLATFIIVLVTKFAEGAWLIVMVVPIFFAFMILVRRHYSRIEKETAISAPGRVELLAPPIAVVPIEQWDSVSEKALQLAYAFSKEVHVVHIQNEVEENDFDNRWHEMERAIAKRGLRPPELVFLKSPYRKVIAPILNYVERISRKVSGAPVAVLIPELVESHWYYSFLHNQRAAILKALLLRKADLKVVVVSVPWRLKKGELSRGAEEGTEHLDSAQRNRDHGVF
jgi:amino acid transporter